MTAVAKLTIEIAANVARLQADMAKVKGTVEGAMGAVKSSVNGVRAGLAGLAAGLSLGALSGFLKNAIDAADAMDDLSQKIGVSVEDLAGLQLAFKFGGVEASGLQTAMVRLASEASKNSEVFRTLGVSVKGSDGQLKSSRELLGEVAEKFEGLDDGARKTALAVELFGKSGADLIPMLNGGAEGLAEFDAIAQKLGLTISSETAAQAAQFNDTLDLLGQGVQGIGTQVAADLLPTMQNLAGGFLDAFTQGDRLNGLSGALAGAMKVIASAVIVVVDIFRAAVRSIGSFADAIVAITEGRFSDAGAAIANAFTGNLDQLKETVASIKTVWSDTAGESVRAIGSVRQATTNLATANKEAEKTTKAITAAQKDAVARMKEMDKAAEESRKEREVAVSVEAKTADELQKQVLAVRDQIAVFGKSKVEVFEATQANHDFNISVIEMNKALLAMSGGNEAAIAELEKQAQATRDLKAAQADLYKLEGDASFTAAVNERIESQAQANKAIVDDFLDVFKDVSTKSGKQFADDLKRSLEVQFRSYVLRIAVQGALGVDSSGQATGGGILGAIGQRSISDAISNGFASVAGSLFGSASAYAATVPGLTSAAAGSQAAMLAAQTGSFGAAGTAATAAAGGSAAAGFASSALAAAPYIAAAAFIVTSLRSKKISATGLDPAALKPITDATQEGFQGLLEVLGGTGSASFGIGGNTGRQGQNPNFNLSGVVGGRTIFSSSNTAEGQADGLFQTGEIALTEANIADQTTRAIVAALKLSDFADNIDAVIASLDPLNGSLADLNVGLQNAQALAALNEQFKNLEGALGTLSGASISTLQNLFALTGGVEGLQVGLGAFYDAFYSEQEKTEQLTKQVTKAFAQFGVVMPSTREGLRELVDSLDLQDAKQQKLFATILQLTPALDQLIPAFEQVEDAARSLFGGIPDLLQEALGKQISLSRDAANQARDSAKAYIDLSRSLKETGKGLLATASGSGQALLKQQFSEAFGKALQGEKDALSALGGLGSSLVDSLRDTSASSVDFAAQASLIKLQLDQAAEVANALGFNENYQAQLFEVQTAALEVLSEQLKSGNLTEEILREQSELLSNIGNAISLSAEKTIAQLLGVENAQLENLSASDLIASFTGGSETLLQAVLGKLGQQDVGSANVVASLKAGNIEITNYLAQIAAAVKQQSEAAAAETKRVQDLAKAQADLSKINEQRNSTIQAVQSASSAIFSLASQFGVFLNSDQGSPLLSNTAQFGVNSNGLFDAIFNQISTSGGDLGGFKNAFYSTGGLFDQTYGQAGSLQSLRDQIEAQRALITSLGGIPQFAKGGMHSGGIRLVGERGPELEVTGPSRIIPNNQLVGMMRGGNDNREMVAELRALRTEVSQLRSESRIGMSTIAQGTTKTASLFDDVVNGNERISTVVEPM